MSLSLHPAGPPKVIVSFVDGRGVGGFLLDFVPWEPRCRIVPSTRSREDETTPIDLQEVKGLYFVKDFHDLEAYDREYPASEGLGQKLEIVFCDEDRLIGRTYDFNPHQMGFFVSLDDGEGDSIRVFVINRNIRQVRRVRTAQDRMETTTDAQGLSLNLRRSPRVTKEVALRAVWMDHRGRLQSETTATQVVNAHGAQLMLRSPVTPGTEVEVTNLVTLESTRAQVATVRDITRKEGMKVGVELLHPDPGFWTDSPPRDL